jgi:hypothetical protein
MSINNTWAISNFVACLSVCSGTDIDYLGLRFVRRSHLHDSVMRDGLTNHVWEALIEANVRLRAEASQSRLFARRMRQRRETQQNSVSQPGFIFGLEDRGQRVRLDAHRRWWKGPWKNRRRYRWRNLGEKRRGPSMRLWASR